MSEQAVLTLLHADVFFFVTTVVVVSCGLMGLVALVYIVRILQRINRVVKRVHEEADNVVSDVRAFREMFTAEGTRMRQIVQLFAAFNGVKKRSKEQ